MAPTIQADWSPNDWPESLQELRRIDNLLRCSICYEYFNTAVLFQGCSHNYCSLCIRKAMVYNPQCPACFEKTSNNDLKCNRVLDELVKNFVNVRSKLLDIINKPSVQSVPEKKDNVEMSDDSASNFEATPRRLRMNLKTRQKSKKGKSPRLTPRNKRKRPKNINSDSDDNDGDDVTEPQAMEIDQVKSPANTSQPTDDAEAPTSFVECPVCAELISSNTINNHLDLCLISGEKKSSLRSRKKATSTKSNQEPVAASSSTKSPLRLGSHSSSSSHNKMKEKIAGANTYISAGPKKKPIIGIVYAILSEKQLKQKLKEWNLSTQGDRKTLIKRHQEFVVAYNAQCDSLNPKPVSAIVKELEIKEKRKTTKPSNATSTGPNLNLNRDASEEQVDKVHKQYLQENKGQFAKLIEDIKKRKEQGSTLNDKSTTSIDDEDSKQDDGIGSETMDQPQSRNQEVKNESSEDDEKSVVTSGKKFLELELDSSSKIRSKEQKVSCKNSLFVMKSQQTDSEDSEDQNAQQLRTEDPRNLIYIESSPDEGQDEISSAFQRTEKSEKQVPDPPPMSNLSSINESDSSNEDDKDDDGGGDGNDDSDDGNDDSDDGNDDSDETKDDSDETNDDVKNDQDWELKPSFEIANSDEEYNENGESDEDLFATTPRPQTKRRSLRRKKK